MIGYPVRLERAGAITSARSAARRSASCSDSVAIVTRIADGLPGSR
jgi:hypothetical protein